MAFLRSSGLKILLAAFGLAVLTALAGVIAFYFVFVRDLPDLHDVRDYQPALASHVFDRRGQLIGEFFTERRQLTSLEEIPERVVSAFVASEDSTFFEHSGIDYVSILRAADTGAVDQAMALFEQMEEKDAHLFSVANTRRLALTGLKFRWFPLSRSVKM